VFLGMVGLLDRSRSPARRAAYSCYLSKIPGDGPLDAA
jgi:hypothetical protein